MATSFTGHDGPTRGGPAPILRLRGSITPFYKLPPPEADAKAGDHGQLSEAASPAPPETQLPRAVGRAIGQFVFLALIVALMNVATGQSVYATFHWSTVYFAAAIVVSFAAAWILVVRPAADRPFALTCVTAVGTLVAAPGLLPHHTERRLAIDAGPRTVVAGAYRRISGTAPGKGFVTVGREGAPKTVKKLRVDKTGRFSTAQKVDGAQARFAIKYFDGSGTPDNAADKTTLTVITVRDRAPPAVEVVRVANGVSWSMADNSGAATVDLRMRKPGGALVALWPGNRASNHVRVQALVPSTFVGVFKFCARARDRAGNESKPSCVWSRVGAGRNA